MADYATVIMTYLGRLGQQATAREIASATGIAWPTVCKIVKLLVKSKLLQSARGAHGGYGLARAASAINLAEILQAMEEPVGMTECATASHQCSMHARCDVSHHWQVISQVINQTLARYTLADLIAPSISISLHDMTQSRDTYRGCSPTGEKT